MKLWSEIISPTDRHKEPIVFLHGTGASSIMWKNQISFFSRLGHPCLLIDLRGHGSSYEPYETADLQAHLNDLEQTLQISSIQFPAYFVGHSLGSIIAMHFAQKQPAMVKSIFAAGLPGRVIPIVNSAFRLFISGPMQALKNSEFRHSLSWRLRTLIETTPFTLEQIVNNFADINLIESLSGINCPVHLACGRFDPIALYWHSQQIQQKLPNSTLKIFEWGGHNFMDASPKEFNAWISKYL
jgi:pimeloyl-ACP methyl ester carboxylesterase